ncbi:MAG: hypothetical protein LLG37_05510 [Spirochaetia bacterium]|nr:hypothetical protein [Spirochaetia bacterium]
MPGFSVFNLFLLSLLLLDLGVFHNPGRNDHGEKHPDKNFFVKFQEKHLTFTPGADGGSVSTKTNNIFKFTGVFPVS